MKKQLLFKLTIGLACFLFISNCSKQKTGACTLSCGGFGTGDPFVSTTYPFKTEQECKEMGQNRGGSCKASYCPPTGNSNDCYQVYP
jgi:hypothetical protein